MTADAHRFRTVLGREIVDAWGSDEFLASLRKDPVRILSGYGLQPPPHLRISVHADTNLIEHVIANPEWLAKHGPGLMQKLKNEPNAALESLGYNLVDGVEYKVLFNSNEHMNIIIPRKPSYYECSIEKIR